MRKKEILVSFLILLAIVIGSSFYLASQNNQSDSANAEKITTRNDEVKTDDNVEVQSSDGEEPADKIKNSQAAVSFLRDRLGNNANFDYEVVESNNEFYKIKVISKAAKEHGSASTVGVYNVMPDESYGLAF